MVRHFQSKLPGVKLHFYYEAGPCGYWMYRLISSLGHNCYVNCYVVAPSLIPKKPGDRVKTDKRDSLMLTQLLKSIHSSDLKSIYVPAAEDEAIRDISRARESAMLDLKDARYRLKALLLRNHIQYKGTPNWSLKHLRWLTEIVLPHAAQQFVLQEMIQTITERNDRLTRMDTELKYRVKQWRYYPVVKSIQAMRGVRRLLVEGAHSNRYPAKISREMQVRQEGLPREVIDIAWRAQTRLCKRYVYMSKRGKNYNVIMVAIAREMIAFIWAISREVVLPDIQQRV